MDSDLPVVGKLSLIKLKQLIKWSLPKVDESTLDDETLKDIRTRLKDMTWQNAMQVVGEELTPRKTLVKGESKLTVVHIATLDDGFTDNVTHHYCINGDNALRIKDRGVRDLGIGDVVAFDCTTNTDEEEDIVYFDVKKDTQPQVARTLSLEEVFKKMNDVKKNVWDLVHGETAVIEARMTHSFKALKKKGEEMPAWISDDESEGLNVHGSVFQRKAEDDEDSEADYVRLFLTPQKYGHQAFDGLIPRHYADNVMKFLAPEDYLDQIINMIVPRPSDLKVFTMGHVRVESKEGKFKGNISLTPCVGILLDAKSQTPDFLLEPDTDEEADPVDEPEPEPEDEGSSLEQADVKACKNYMKFNRTITLEKMNEMFEKKGLIATEKVFKEAKYELGVK